MIADLNGRLDPDAVLYVVTTLAVDFARGLGDHAAADGPRLIELPVSGGRGGAERGELIVSPAAPRPGRRTTPSSSARSPPRSCRCRATARRPWRSS